MIIISILLYVSVAVDLKEVRLFNQALCRVKLLLLREMYQAYIMNGVSDKNFAYVCDQEGMYS